MREIKFRGASIDMTKEAINNPVARDDARREGKRWVYGALNADPAHSARVYIRPDGGRSGEPGYEVHPASVGQYTGMKDANGVEIYEGDIIRSDKTFGLEGVVVYDEDNAYFELDCKGVNFQLWKLKGSDFEIIGNDYN